MSVIRQSTRPNEWVGVDYPGDPLTPVFLGFSLGSNNIGWRPAFYDSGKALIRCPRLDPGLYDLWIRQGENIARASRVRVLS